MRNAYFFLVAFGLLGDDHVLDFVVGGLRDDILVHQIVFAGIGAAGDDFSRIRIANPRERFQLIRRCRVDVDKSGFGGAEVSRRGLRLREAVKASAAVRKKAARNPPKRVFVIFIV